jgi:hypothetical protein
MRAALEFNVGSKRNIAPRHSVRSLAAAVETLDVQLRVNCLRIEDTDRLLIAFVIGAPAECARPVSCR